jgi:pyruvate-formate lyase-activating enzyme
MSQFVCDICERGCRVAEGAAGACGMYRRSGDRMVEVHPNRYLVACPISIETMPILHFHPGGKFFQISTTGCNFECPGCISTVIVKEMLPESRALRTLSPEVVVDQAMGSGCLGIVFLMNDPLASLPTFLKVARLARKRGLLVGCSSNTYFTENALQELIGCIDFINVGIKGFSDAAYRACGAPGLDPVVRNLTRLVRAGIHVEVSCIHTRENREELQALARCIADMDRRIPLQVMRFIPMEGADADLEPSIREAEAFCGSLRRSLDYVYLFNSPGTRYLHSFCPECDLTFGKREFYGPMGAKLKIPPEEYLTDGRCSGCGHEMNVWGLRKKETYDEEAFQGGYPFTRALEMVQAMLIAMGVGDRKIVVRAWEEVLTGDRLKALHHIVQDPRQYIGMLRELGRLLDIPDRAEALAAYLEERLFRIKAALAFKDKCPRVYYAMGTPLFYLNGERLENHLVMAAGGISVNLELPEGGRPGMSLPVPRLNELNPEIIFISAFISSTVTDFSEECIRLGVDVAALRNQRIYAHPASGWDFGSPRWILGLMYMANVFHPECFDFDVEVEARMFYRKFYNMDFEARSVNRSFSKPSSGWRWSA